MVWTERDRIRARANAKKRTMTRWFRKIDRDLPAALAETARILAQYPEGLTLKALKQKLGHAMSDQAVRERLYRLRDEYGLARQGCTVGRSRLWQITIEV